MSKSGSLWGQHTTPAWGRGRRLLGTPKAGARGGGAASPLLLGHLQAGARPSGRREAARAERGGQQGRCSRDTSQAGARGSEQAQGGA